MPTTTRSAKKAETMQKTASGADLTTGTLSSSSDSEDDSATAAAKEAFPTGLSQRRNKKGAKGASTTTTNTSTIMKTPSQPSSFTAMRWVEFITGSTIFFCALPFVTFQIICCTLWEFLDQSTLRMCELATKLNTLTGPYQEWLVSNPKDSFVVNTTIWLGFCLPCYFLYEAYCQTHSDHFIWWRAALYNIVRIGPMYRNFMYVYVLCHKEAHCFGKIWKSPYDRLLGNIYNYYVGFFHGVLPGPFTQSHIYNHHKYDNAKLDVYSTGAFPRDSFFYFLHYIYVWFLYALNISTMVQFYKENKMRRVFNTFLGTAFFATMVAAVWHFCGPLFTAVYVLYPVIEGNILLAMVNFTWHAFIDPEDPDNDYVNSVTILEGLNFCLSEEYHVVHHQYAGIHWSRHEEMYEKHKEDYIRCTATVFQKCNLFVIWGMIVAKDYEGLTEHYVQLEPDEKKHLSKQELAQLLKERLQCTTWSYGG
ncbi:MAG: hypothetical protein SGILL_003069 [Bacillariaceae sp.]